MKDLQILVAFEFAELHETAWTFGDDDISAGGFEILVFIVEDFRGGVRKIDLEGAGAATAHGGVFRWQIGDGFFEQSLWFLVDALAAIEMAGGVVSDAQLLARRWPTA